MYKCSEKDIKEILLNILIYFDEICKKNKLKYSLAYGTMLGAARHKGFIPWDDDIDVLMPISDYLKLKKILGGLENSRFCLHDLETENKYNETYFYPFMKLEDKNTSIKFKKNRDKGGAFIDIFPLNGLPTDFKERKNFLKKQRLLNRKLAFTNKYDKNFLKSLIRWIKRLQRRSIIKKIFSNACKFSYDDSLFVGNSVWSGKEKDVFEKNLFDEYVEIEFEGHYFMVVKQYENVLSQLYGNWKELPSIEERVGHHYYDLFFHGDCYEK